jgi:hypothetical protein
MAETWEAIAHLLGSRMRHQANNCPEDHIADRDAPNCPFCADRVAYLRYLAKCRGERYVSRMRNGADDG